MRTEEELKYYAARTCHPYDHQPRERNCFDYLLGYVPKIPNRHCHNCGDTMGIYCYYLSPTFYMGPGDEDVPICSVCEETYPRPGTAHLGCSRGHNMCDECSYYADWRRPGRLPDGVEIIDEKGCFPNGKNTKDLGCQMARTMIAFDYRGKNHIRVKEPTK